MLEFSQRSWYNVLYILINKKQFLLWKKALKSENFNNFESKAIDFLVKLRNESTVDDTLYRVLI